MVFVAHGHSWLEIARRERQKPCHFLDTSVDKQIFILLCRKDEMVKMNAVSLGKPKACTAKQPSEVCPLYDLTCVSYVSAMTTKGLK